MLCDNIFDAYSFIHLPQKGILIVSIFIVTAATAKSLQSCLTLCNPIDGSSPGSPVPGILQARTLEWVAISFSMHESEKRKSSRSVVSNPQRSHGLQPSRLLHTWDFPGKSTGVGCHCLTTNNKFNIYIYIYIYTHAHTLTYICFY